MDQNLEERVVDTTQAEWQKGKRMIKNEDGLRDFWDNIPAPLNINKYLLIFALWGV